MSTDLFDTSFFSGKRVFVTGHTGFKGSWLCRILLDAGAEVTGYALDPPTDPSLFSLAGLANQMDSHIGDVRDFDALKGTFDVVKPEIVLHLAAQPIVRTGYAEPRYTYETNVMGTVNLLECVRTSDCVRSFLNVTTDKVYLNRELSDYGYCEDDKLDGYDPYSNSKSCSELVTHSYRNSFLAERGIPVSTARAGNVLGGGDFSPNRIVPDCVRAAVTHDRIVVRNPDSTRPYQHVLEPLFVYLMIAKNQYEDMSYSGYYNVGPDDCDCVTTGQIATLFCNSWNAHTHAVPPLRWLNRSDGGPHEASFLKLDCSKLKDTFGWAPRWHIEEVIDKTVEWTDIWYRCGDIGECMSAQIDSYRKG